MSFSGTVSGYREDPDRRIQNQKKALNSLFPIAAVGDVFRFTGTTPRARNVQRMLRWILAHTQKPMSAADSKKLITWFLILAAVASSSALVASNSISPQARPTALETQSGAKLSEPPVPSNAFVEGIPPISGGRGARGEDELTPPPSTDNLTDALAQNLARELIRGNPQGPQYIAGNLSLLAPSGIRTQLVMLETVKNFEFHDAAEEITPEQIKTVPPSPERIDKYLTNAQEIMWKTTASQEFKELLAKRPTLETPSVVQFTLAEAVKRFMSLEVPESLVPLHKRWTGMLKNQERVYEAIANYQSDPLKTIIAFRHQDEIVARDNKAFSEEAERVNRKLRLGNAVGWNSGIVVYLHKIINVPVARGAPVPPSAMVPVNTDPSPVNTSTNLESFAKQLIAYYRVLFTETLKDRLIHTLANQVINWVNGGGKPQFITNWKAFFKKQIDDAAGLAIEGIAPGLCRSFGPLVQLNLEQAYLAPPPPVSCTLEQIVKNVQDFYRSFSTGGWIAYGATVLPSGNFYGSLFEKSQIVELRRLAEKEAAKEEARAGESFLSPKICVKERTVTTYDKDGNPEKLKVCDKWQITTPGGAIAHSLNKALGSSFDRIVNANDFEAIISSLVNAALSRLIRAGVAGLQKVAEGGGGAGSLFNLCDGLTGAERENCLQVAGAVGRGLAKQDMLDYANRVLANKEIALDAVGEHINAIGQALLILNSAATADACPNSSALANVQAKITELTNKRMELRTQQTTLRQAVANLSELIAEAEAHDENDDAYFTSKEVEIDATYGGGGSAFAASQLEAGEARAAADLAADSTAGLAAEARQLVTACSQ